MTNRNENRNEMIVRLSERPGETVKVIKTRNYSATNNKKVKKKKSPNKNKSKKSQRKSAQSPKKKNKNKKKKTKNYRRN